MMQKLDLNGKWKLLHSDGERGRPEYALNDQIDASRYFDATVPGAVHLDMMAAGLIADPVKGLNSLSARWIEECIWAYRREFEFSENEEGRPVWLVFETLDLNAKIYVNGEVVGSHENAFVPCRLEVGRFLRAGTNTLVVIIESGIIGAGDKQSQGLGSKDAYHYGQNLHKQHWLRKPAFEFGWDWAARLGNVGVSGDVWLEWSEQSVCAATVVPLVQVHDDLRSATLTLRATADNTSATAQTVRVDAAIAELDWTADESFTVAPGVQTLELVRELRGFELWWPVGTGEAKLYDLSTSLQVDGQRIQYSDKRLGFRLIKMNQDPHPDGGNYCVMEVNHRRVFLKGANWVPADMIIARIDEARYRMLIDRALEANFNFIRVWGGGLYESDTFYDLCDEQGLLVWQDCAFACKKYPLNDEALYRNAHEEMRYQIKRLANHPSLAVWCGNNEMEWGNWDWGFDQGVIYPDHAFFHLVIPRLLQTEDPTRFYQPSSPFSPDGASPNLDDRGDQHNWTVSLEHSDYRKFRDMECRLINEGGYLGPTSLPGMRECFPAEQTPKIGNFAWYHHDNSVDSWHPESLPDSGFRDHMGHDIRALSLEAYTYLGGLLHGEALATFSDNFRRRQFDSAAACFWMFNDCWPATRSWTIVDYGLRRTPAFWVVKRAFASVRLVVTHEAGQYHVYGVNDQSEAVAGLLRYGYCAFAGSYDNQPEQNVVLNGNRSQRLASFADRGDPEQLVDAVAYAQLLDESGEQVLTHNRFIGPKLRELKLSPADVQVSVAGGWAVFRSSVFALGISIDLDGETALMDNFFDLYPDQEYSIPWAEDTPPDVIGQLSAYLEG